MSEIGLNWKKLPKQRHLGQHIKRLNWGDKSKVVMATNKHNKIDKRVRGGTAMIIRDDLVDHCIKDKLDKTGLGRWASTVIEGKKRKKRIL